MNKKGNRLQFQLVGIRQVKKGAGLLCALIGARLWDPAAEADENQPIQNGNSSTVSVPMSITRTVVSACSCGKTSQRDKKEKLRT